MRYSLVFRGLPFVTFREVVVISFLISGTVIAVVGIVLAAKSIAKPVRSWIFGDCLRSWSFI